MESLDEWVEKREPTRLLRDNIKTNIEVMTDLEADEVDSLVRLQLIMMRQCAQQLGVG